MQRGTAVNRSPHGKNTECLKKVLSFLKIVAKLEMQEFWPRHFGRQVTTRYGPKAQALPAAGVSPASASGPSLLFNACPVCEPGHGSHGSAVYPQPPARFLARTAFSVSVGLTNMFLAPLGRQHATRFLRVTGQRHKPVGSVALLSEPQLKLQATGCRSSK